MLRTDFRLLFVVARWNPLSRLTYSLQDAVRRFATAPEQQTGEGASPLFADLGHTVLEQSTETKIAKACLRNIKTSPQKLNLLAAQIRGLSVNEALKQMQFSLKRAAGDVHKTISVAKARAENNLGLDGARLLIDQAWVGKGVYRKAMKFHAKGRFGRVTHPTAQLTVLVREVTQEEGEKRLGKFGWTNATWDKVDPQKLIPSQDQIRPPRIKRSEKR